MLSSLLKRFLLLICFLSGCYESSANNDDPVYSNLMLSDCGFTVSGDTMYPNPDLRYQILYLRDNKCVIRCLNNVEDKPPTDLNGFKDEQGNICLRVISDNHTVYHLRLLGGYSHPLYPEHALPFTPPALYPPNYCSNSGAIPKQMAKLPYSHRLPNPTGQPAFPHTFNTSYNVALTHDHGSRPYKPPFQSLQQTAGPAPFTFAHLQQTAGPAPFTFAQQPRAYSERPAADKLAPVNSPVKEKQHGASQSNKTSHPLSDAQTLKRSVSEFQEREKNLHGIVEIKTKEIIELRKQYNAMLEKKAMEAGRLTEKLIAQQQQYEKNKNHDRQTLQQKEEQLLLNSKQLQELKKYYKDSLKDLHTKTEKEQELERKVSAQTKQADEKDRTISAQKETIKTLEINLKTLSEKKKEAQQNISELKTKIETYSKKVHEKKAAEAEVETEKSAKIEALEKSIKEREEAQKKLEKQHAKKQKDKIRNDRAQQAKKDRKLEKMEAGNAALTHENTSLKQKQKQVEKELDSLKKKMEKTTEESEELKEKNSQNSKRYHMEYALGEVRSGMIGDQKDEIKQYLYENMFLTKTLGTLISTPQESGPMVLRGTVFNEACTIAQHFLNTLNNPETNNYFIKTVYGLTKYWDLLLTSLLEEGYRLLNKICLQPLQSDHKKEREKLKNIFMVAIILRPFCAQNDVYQSLFILLCSRMSSAICLNFKSEKFLTFKSLFTETINENWNTLKSLLIKSEKHYKSQILILDELFFSLLAKDSTRVGELVVFLSGIQKPIYLTLDHKRKEQPGNYEAEDFYLDMFSRLLSDIPESNIAVQQFSSFMQQLPKRLNKGRKKARQKTPVLTLSGNSVPAGRPCDAATSATEHADKENMPLPPANRHSALTRDDCICDTDKHLLASLYCELNSVFKEEAKNEDNSMLSDNTEELLGALDLSIETWGYSILTFESVSPTGNTETCLFGNLILSYLKDSPNQSELLQKCLRTLEASDLKLNDMPGIAGLLLSHLDPPSDPAFYESAHAKIPLLERISDKIQRPIILLGGNGAFDRLETDSADSRIETGKTVAVRITAEETVSLDRDKLTQQIEKCSQPGAHSYPLLLGYTKGSISSETGDTAGRWYTLSHKSAEQSQDEVLNEILTESFPSTPDESLRSFNEDEETTPKEHI